MRAKSEDEILKRLTNEDLPDGCGVLLDYLGGDLDCLTAEIKNSPFYVGDGLDLMRYIIKHMGGITVNVPNVYRMRDVWKRYVLERASQSTNLKRLSCEIGVDERTLRKYLQRAGGDYCECARKLAGKDKAG